MPEAAFVMSARQDESVRELAETLMDELGRQGVATSLNVGAFPAPHEGEVPILLDPGTYVAGEGPGALPDDALLRRSVFISREPPPRDAGDPQLALLGRAGAVFVDDQLAVAATHRLGVPGRLLRAGYAPLRDHYDPDAARPIDVLFAGRHSSRRVSALHRMAPILARHNCLIQIGPDEPVSAPTSSHLGSSRWSLLARTKIVVLLHHDERTRFDWQAAVDAAHCGAVIVSEHSSGISPFDPGQQLLVSSAEAMGYVIDALLADDVRLAALRSSAYERLSDWIPYALPVSVLRAAIVELVGEPVPERAPIDVASPPPASEPPAVRTDDDRVLAELSRAQRELVTLRREVAARARAAAADAPAVRVLHRSTAWSGRRAPRVSALVCVGGVPGRIAATLDSLVTGRMRDLEVVLVASATETETFEQAQQWLDDHPRVPVIIAVAPAVTTAGGAWNVGRGFARGELCLLIDPGQRLAPHGLQRLAALLADMPEMAFAYPIAEVIGDAEAFTAAGGAPLLNQRGWDPGHLRDGDPVLAPALVRAHWLRKLGGFAEDPRLAGRELWDLWCRIAQAHGRGQLLAQIVAQRVEDGESDALGALRAPTGPVLEALHERAPSII